MRKMMLCSPEKALALALTREGCPYIWGADGPDGFDCSGLVCWAIKEAGGPDWRASHSSQAMFDALEPISIATPGQICLAFYGKTSVTHVMWVVGDGRVFGACGGDARVTNPQIAKERDACVRFRSRAAYRGDLIGFRLLQPRLPRTNPFKEPPHAA